MAPHARQGTAFQKHGCTNAGSVKESEFLDVKDNTRGHGQSIKSFRMGLNKFGLSATFFENKLFGKRGS